MKFNTTNFGQLEIDVESIILIPDGIIGFEQSRHWVLLSERDDDAIGWLQSLSDPDLVFSVVTPHRFVANYQLVIERRQLSSLPWLDDDEAVVLALISKNQGQFTANLKAPIVINLNRGLGRQVVVADDQPLQYALSGYTEPVRKSA